MVATSCCVCTFGLLLSALSIVLLVVLLSHFYAHLRTVFYQESRCVIYKAVYTVQFACECGPGCKALYPCLLVNAFLNGSIDSPEDRQWPIYVYRDDWQLIAINTAEEKMREQCYYKTCSWSTNTNRDNIERIRQGLPKGKVFKCYFDPNNYKHGAFIERKLSWTIAFHVMFWPLLLFVIGMVVCLLNIYIMRNSCASSGYALTKGKGHREKPCRNMAKVDKY